MRKKLVDYNHTIILIPNYTTLKSSSKYSIFWSTNFNTCSTSSTEWSSPFTRCRYKSVFVLSTEPSLFSWTLKSSILTTDSVTRAKCSRNTDILSRISDGWARRTNRTRWSSRSRYMNTCASSYRPSVSLANTWKMWIHKSRLWRRLKNHYNYYIFWFTGE